MDKRQTWPGSLARCLAALSLALWVGSLIFFGAVAAPVVTQVTRDDAHGVRSLGFIAVGGMLSRFLPILYGSGALAVVCWLVQGKSARASRVGWLQGICTIAMLALMIFGGAVLNPRMIELQPRLLPQLQHAWDASPQAAKAPTSELLPGVDPVLKAEFDAAHKQFQTVVMLAWWLAVIGLAALVVNAERSLNAERGNRNAA